MRGLRRLRPDGVVPLWVYGAVVLGLVAAVTIVVLGMREQADRRIGGVNAATLMRLDTQARPIVVERADVGRAEANRLVRALNALPRLPSGEWNCGAYRGRSFRVRFVADGGAPLDVRVADGGCLTVDVHSDGLWWGWGKWDPSGRIRAEIVRDLRNN